VVIHGSRFLGTNAQRYILVPDHARTNGVITACGPADRPTGRLLCIRRVPAQECVIVVPSTFMHSRMKAARPVQPLAETILPSTYASCGLTSM